MSGYFRIHRDLFQKPIWQNSTSNQRCVLIAILNLANWEYAKWEWQGQPYECQPGEFVSSYANIANAAGKGVTRDMVRKSLIRFQKLGFSTHHSTHGYKDGIKVCICNWGKYQNVETTPQTTFSPDLDKTETTCSPPKKNNKKEKNNIVDIKKFVKPSIEEIQNYISQRNSTINANDFFDYYEANGWKVGKNPMKDWQATIRTWENRNKKDINHEYEETSRYKEAQ